MSSQKKKEIHKQKKPLILRYDLACGNNLQKGFIGVDITKKNTRAKIECNLLIPPWPIESTSADELFSSHFIEHIPHGNGYNDPFWDFFNEAWRVLKPGGIFRVICPYFTSVRAFQDPTHQRFISEVTFVYLDREWRDLNKLHHYPINTNFKVEKIDYAISEEFVGRSQEVIKYSALHSWNVVNDILVTLKKPQ